MSALKPVSAGIGLVLAFVANLAAAQDVVGKISTSRATTYSSSPTRLNASYSPVKPEQPVRNGDGVRVGRRGFAQISFNDRSVLRLSEMTELIVQDSATLRRLQLAKGALWVRVTRGSNTAIKTPSATATVRGTEFLLDEFGNLAVRDGMVELEGNGFTIEVYAGEIAGIGPDGKPYKKGLKIPTEDQGDPYELGIPELWWRRLKGLPDPTSDEWMAGLALLPFLFANRSDGRDRQDAVPEPTTMSLVIGAGYLVWRSRRKRH